MSKELKSNNNKASEIRNNQVFSNKENEVLYIEKIFNNIDTFNEYLAFLEEKDPSIDVLEELKKLFCVGFKKN